MRIYYSTLCNIGCGISEAVDQEIRCGGRAIELMLDGSGWDGFESRSREIAEMLLAKHVAYSVHAPVWDINLTSENRQAREAALQTYQYAIAFASLIHAKHVVLHPGYCDTPAFDKRTACRRAEEAFQKLCRFNESYRVTLLAENVGKPSTSIFTEEEFASFIESFSGRIGCLIDIGHANLCGWNIPGMIARLRPFLYAVHLHDNDGTSDSHLPIGEGTVPWNDVFYALKNCRQDLRLILEYNIGIPVKKLLEGKNVLLRFFPEDKGRSI